MSTSSEGDNTTAAQNWTGTHPAVITVPVNIPLPEKTRLERRKSGSEVATF